jgi:hypothetical protein
MKKPDKSTILEFLKKAKKDYTSGLRYYDDKHDTYSPAKRSENILEHVSDLLGFYGIEAFDPEDSNPICPKYSYINSGDTYDLTLIFNHDSGCFLITDIGSIIEKGL